MDALPPELLLEGYSPGIRRAVDRLRAVVKRAVPNAIERVRPGWGLIGYDVPVGKRTRYFAFVWPDWMDDSDYLLRGARIKLRKVRFVTYEPGEAIPEPALVRYTREAARIASMSCEERMARELDRD